MLILLSLKFTWSQKLLQYVHQRVLGSLQLVTLLLLLSLKFAWGQQLLHYIEHRVERRLGAGAGVIGEGIAGNVKTRSIVDLWKGIGKVWCLQES